eukprot:2802271-Amphidinium_carterae.1
MAAFGAFGTGGASHFKCRRMRTSMNNPRRGGHQHQNGQMGRGGTAPHERSHLISNKKEGTTQSPRHANKPLPHVRFVTSLRAL